MKLQMIIVIVIGVVVASVILRSMYRFFFNKDSSNGCGSCSGCEFNPHNADK